MTRIGFIIEQALGHVTHGANLMHNIGAARNIDAVWGLPKQNDQSWPGRIGNWTVSAGLQSRRLIAQMQQEQPLDALFFHTQVAAIFCQDWMRRIPSIVSLDATPLQYDQLGTYYDHESGTTAAERVKFWLNRRCYQAASHLITWSQWTKDSLINDYGVNPNKITVIPPGVNVADWQTAIQRPQHRPVRILFVGGNLKRKGGLLLLDTLQQLRGSGVPVELHLVTRDAIAPQDGVIVYNDLAPNSQPLKNLYHRSDIFCLPTYGDCLPLALSEAGAAGLPLISTKVAAIPELIVDGHTGLLIEPGDREALAAAICRLVEHTALRHQLGAQAHARAAAKYDAATNALHLFAKLHEIAHDPSARAVATI